MKKTCRNHPNSILFGIWTLLALILLLPQGAYAQSGRANATIKGVVVEKENPNVPVEFATVRLLPAGLITLTDSKGNFTFERVAPGRVELAVELVGMVRVDATYTLQAGATLEVNLEMEWDTFRLNEVIVTATANKAGQSTASTISRQAMDHMQTSSINDVMQLIPGGTIRNPSLSTPERFTIRNSGSLGTSIIVDGAPMPTNANMQAVSPTINARPGDAILGVDARLVTTDRVEDITVITGIPSVEFGDLNSGVVLIRSRAGYEPLNFRIVANPLTYEVAGRRGVNLSEKAGSLNVGIDYTHNRSSLSTAFNYYQRATGQLLYSNFINKKWQTNTTLNIDYGKDTRDVNPNDGQMVASSERTLGIRLNTNGTVNIQKGWLSTISYVLFGSYHDAYTWYTRTGGNAGAPHSTSMVNATVSSKPGQRVYDVDGKEITNISPLDPNAYCMFLPSIVVGDYEIFGKEIGVFAKVNANFFKRFNNGSNKIFAGADFKTDGNVGEGKVFDITRPPYRQGMSTTPRPRAYKDVPFINQLGLYLENSFTYEFGRHEFRLSAGLRYDNINGKDVLSPRLNASVDIIPNLLALRGGYGVAAKAPTLLFLYPEDAYFVRTNFNTLDAANVPESEQLMVGTSYVFNTENPNLQIATNQKLEAGFDLSLGKRVRAAVTVYHETMRNGYDLDYDPELSFHLTSYAQYREGVRNLGNIPTLELLRNPQNVWHYFPLPFNSRCSDNSGVEFSIDFGRIQSLRTHFALAGAFTRSSSWSNMPSYNSNAYAVNSPLTFPQPASTVPNPLSYHIGIYDAVTSKTLNERLVTTLRTTHNIPRIGLAASLVTQIMWIDKSGSVYYNDSTFTRYLSWEDGLVHNWETWMAEDPEYRYMLQVPDARRHIREVRPPLLTFQLQVSKEIGDFLRASFFVNNLFDQRPRYESKRNPGNFSQRGVAVFYGFELRVTLK